jgi:hypothetical protein
MFGKRHRPGSDLVQGPHGGPRSRLARWRPFAVMIAAISGLTVLCQHLLNRAADSSRDMTPAILAVAGGFLLISGAVVMVQAMKVARRVAGPEHCLRQAMRRIRNGDLAFRVHLRKGDLLVELAEECNELLDWLNHNPPAGAVTGSDVVEVGQVSMPEVQSELLVEEAVK